MNVLNFFLLLWVIFALLDSDPDSESGSTDPIKSGSNWDPDPQPWFWQIFFLGSAAETRPGHRVLQDVEKAQLYLQTAPGMDFMFLKWRRTVCIQFQ